MRRASGSKSRFYRALRTESCFQLPPASDLGNLVAFSDLPHTRFTYHRTWETGLETEIRVAAFSPAFFAYLTHANHYPAHSFHTYIN
jgi:hypothetical protein